MQRAIIFSNGNLSNIDQVKKIITKKDFLIAADGGVKYIFKLGLNPDVVIGDFDSVSTTLQKKLDKQKIKLIKYPRKKDETDFELTINFILEKEFKEIIIFGILGDRIDHFLANIFLLAKIQTENQNIKIKIIEGNKEIYILNKEIIIYGKVGDEISIVPISQKLKGVTTKGLYYRLIDETLSFGSTRGVSNVMTKTLAKITVSAGTAVVEHNLQ